jgi:flagellar biosynthetic protein FliP
MKLARYVLTLLLAASSAWGAQGPASLMSISLTQSKGSVSLGAPMQIIVLLTLLTILPAVIMTVTPFLRITIVLHFLRQALGTQGTPSNQVLIGLALFLTLLIMQPVVSEMYHKGWEPLEQGQVTWEQGFDDGAKPLQAFLVRYVRDKDVRLFLDVSHTPAPQRPSDLSLSILMPAYVISELKTAFQIGAVLYLPFLVIDLVVASVTLSIGMVQLPPVMLSAPFKIMLFVLVDGWNLVVGSLVRSFYQT